jgi:hypothetical protein
MAFANSSTSSFARLRLARSVGPTNQHCEHVLFGERLAIPRKPPPQSLPLFTQFALAEAQLYCIPSVAFAIAHLLAPVPLLPTRAQSIKFEPIRKLFKKITAKSLIGARPSR